MKTKVISPLKNLVLVELEPSKDKQGSIYIPETSDERLAKHFANVIAVGPKVKELLINDKVIVPAYGGVVAFDENGIKRKFFKETEIMAKYK